MTDCTVSLDDFQFADMEVPEQIPFGGSQRLVVKNRAGGARVVQAMGREDDALTWSGVFLGENALERSRYLDYLRAEGAQHILTWHEFRYLVVIRDYKPSFMRFYRLPYTITLEVIADLAQPVVSFPQPSVDNQMNADNVSAQGLGGLISDAQLSSLLGGLDSAISTVSSFAKATTATIQSVLQPIQAVQQRVTTLLASASNTLTSAGTIGGLLPNSPIAAKIASLNSSIAATEQTPNLVQLQSVLGRMTTNANLIQGPLNSHTDTVAGTNLYALSEKEYGDPTQWGVIARANGLVDPQIAGIQTLTIPNSPGPASGGILAP